MKKSHFLIIILVLIVAFAAADYFINAPLEKLPNLSQLQGEDTQVAENYPNIIQLLLDDNAAFDYTLAKRSRTKQIFEKFDFSSVNDIVIFKNILDKKTVTDSPDKPGDYNRIIIYEIQGPANQGRLTYLSLKTKLVDQMDVTGSINEVSGYGYNSFFYNDLNNQNTGFLFIQVKDNLFGFQYEKNNEPGFETIKQMIEALKRINLLT
jgi:hypothetical protein